MELNPRESLIHDGLEFLFSLGLTAYFVLGWLGLKHGAWHTVRSACGLGGAICALFLAAWVNALRIRQSRRRRSRP